MKGTDTNIHWRNQKYKIEIKMKMNLKRIYKI